MNAKPTIFALSSGSGRAGIAVLRVSGSLAAQSFATFAVKKPPPRLASLRRLKTAAGDILDEALALWLPGPGTATGEDMAEFHLHGSPAIVTAALRQLSTVQGFRLAEPGEFTRRAFENDRLDLLQVEGLADLIAAETQSQHRLAMRQFLGDASTVYGAWRKELLEALALAEAAIDFSEEADVAQKAWAQSRPRLLALIGHLEKALAQADRVAAVRRGLRVVLAGPPNAGKSSLLNWLTGREAAIVSPTPGTTRDVVEAGVVFAGVNVLLADTAGLRSAPESDIEAEGIRRTQASAQEADILIWIEAANDTDAVGPPRAPDLRVLNKTDLLRGGDSTQESIRSRNDRPVGVSVKTGDGLGALRTRLEGLISQRAFVAETDVVVRERHRMAVHHALEYLRHAAGFDGDALEFAAEDMRKAARALSGITGRIDVEDLLGQIFQDFCIGK